MAKTGRKNKYYTHVEPYLEKIPYWRKDGLTEKQIAKKLGVAYSSFNEYKNAFPELSEVLKKGKEELIQEIEDSLYKRALGFEYEETKTYIEKDDKGKEKKKIEKIKKLMVGDVTAIIFSLKNLRPEKWKDKQELLHAGTVVANVNLDYMSDEEIEKELEELENK